MKGQVSPKSLQIIHTMWIDNWSYVVKQPINVLSEGFKVIWRFKSKFTILCSDKSNTMIEYYFIQAAPVHIFKFLTFFAVHACCVNEFVPLRLSFKQSIIILSHVFVTCTDLINQLKAIMKKIYHYHSCTALADHIATQNRITNCGMSFKDNSQLKKMKKTNLSWLVLFCFDSKLPQKWCFFPFHLNPIFHLP